MYCVFIDRCVWDVFPGSHTPTLASCVLRMRSSRARALAGVCAHLPQRSVDGLWPEEWDGAPGNKSAFTSASGRVQYRAEEPLCVPRSAAGGRGDPGGEVDGERGAERLVPAASIIHYLQQHLIQSVSGGNAPPPGPDGGRQPRGLLLLRGQCTRHPVHGTIKLLLTTTPPPPYLLASELMLS